MRTNLDATDYALSDEQVDWLAGMVSLPAEFRREAAMKIAERHGVEFLADTLAQFIGLANSVIENSHSFLEIAAIVDGDMHPNDAEKLNFPTLFGAVMGAKLAKFGCEGMCSGCAFSLGSHANQSASTTTDADWCGHPGEQPFMCHEGLDDDGEPTRPCAGWVKFRQARKAHPLSAQ